jgi:hypothetical protein
MSNFMKADDRMGADTQKNGEDEDSAYVVAVSAGESV